MTVFDVAGGMCCGGLCQERTCVCGPDLHGLNVLGVWVDEAVGVPVTEPDDDGDTPHTDLLDRVEAVTGILSIPADVPVGQWSEHTLLAASPVLFPEATAAKIEAEQIAQMAAEARARQLVFPPDETEEAVEGDGHDDQSV